MEHKQMIGVFDSGIGGISVLREMARVLPHENFLYYGDSANAPYGDKTDEEIIRLSKNIMQHFLDAGVKAVVIACNTATSAAAQILRREHPDMPIIGIEPALKPAVEDMRGGIYLVMATEATLRLEKFHTLEHRLEDAATFIPLACGGLADLVETGELHSAEMKAYLQRILAPYVGKVDGVVLGCTHYPFVRDEIAEVMGDIHFYDGAHGTSMELARRLRLAGIKNESPAPGKVVFESSNNTERELALYRKFFTMTIQ